jgi:hypothetical protein
MILKYHHLVLDNPLGMVYSNPSPKKVKKFFIRPGWSKTNFSKILTSRYY